MLEWTIFLSQINYQQLLQNISINVVPDPEVPMMYIGNRTLQLTLLYNTLYNVSITQPGICRQPNQIAFIGLSYSKQYTSKINVPITHSDRFYPYTGKRSHPMNLTNDIRVTGYEDPALEGEVITLTCPSGL